MPDVLQIEDAAVGAASAGLEGAGVPAGNRSPVTAASFRRLAERLRKPRTPPVAAPFMAEPKPLRRADDMVPAPEAAAALTSAESVPPAPKAGADESPPPDPGEEAGEAAMSLLDLMAATTGLLPQERALAGDTLLLLLPLMPERHLVRLAERVAMMDTPPPLLAAHLIRDPRPAIMGPLLERSMQLCERDTLQAAPLQDTERLRMIARRRTLSPVLSGHVVQAGEPTALLMLLRNAEAQLPQQGFARLCELAAEYPVLRAPLATRADIPAWAAFELYWNLPSELRRLMLSRFLTDSGTLAQILRMASAHQLRQETGQLREDEAGQMAMFDDALDQLGAQRVEEAAARFAGLAGIRPETALRILRDPEGEPVAVLFKALGLTRARFEAALQRLWAGGQSWKPGRSSEELRGLFDGLSFTKARVLLTYWDWFQRRTGPYAPLG